MFRTKRTNLIRTLTLSEPFLHLVYLLDNFYGAIALTLLFVLRAYLSRYVALGGVLVTIWAPSITATISVGGCFVAEGNAAGNAAGGCWCLLRLLCLIRV
ncbi:MAG: hypothetical protein RLZZ515_48 [Cyanobacteriota bacterium]